jgi:hypothetical protein
MIGVWLTVVVTKSLLNKQTEEEVKKHQVEKKAEEELQKSVKIFEEKLIIYKEFLLKLHEVVKVEKITEDHIKELIFQIAYVAMHTHSDRIIAILEQLKDIIDEKENGSLAQKLLEVVLILQKELYGEILGEKINDEAFQIFDQLVSAIEKDTNVTLPSNKTIEVDKIEVQKYFWKELMKQLENHSPKWSKTAIEQDVTEYYARSRNRHRYFGFSFTVYESITKRNVGFYVEVENDYCYGFAWMDKPYSDPILSSIIKQVSRDYKSNEYWAGWKWPDYSNDTNRHDLNFWKMTPESSMQRLIDPCKREKLVKDIAEEMEIQIEKFIELAQKNNL